MEIIEQFIEGKRSQKESEDGIVVTPDFIAVIDGSTSKSQYRHSLWRSNGRQAMKIVARYISRMPAKTSSEQFLKGVTAEVRRHYRRTMLERLEQHPEDRLTCSVAVYSRLCREVWMVGDCQCLIDGELYDNPKPYYPDCEASSFGPTWHTVNDDMQHIDRNTLQAVGQTMIQVLFSEK